MKTSRAIEIVVMGVRGCRVCDGSGLVEVSPDAPTGDCPRCREPEFKYRATGLDPDSQAEVNTAIAKLEADARALWAVRVLDRWAAESRGYHRVRGNWNASLYAVRGEGSCGCQLMSEEGHEGRTFLGSDQDAARIAAAEALVAEDPSLGEGL